MHPSFIHLATQPYTYLFISTGSMYTNRLIGLATLQHVCITPQTVDDVEGKDLEYYKSSTIIALAVELIFMARDMIAVTSIVRNFCGARR